MSRASRELIGQGISQAFQSIGQGYAQKQKNDRNQAILNDPKATPLQKAMALGDNPKLSSAYYIEQSRQSNLQQIAENVRNQLNPQGAGGPQMASRNAVNSNQFINTADMVQPSSFLNPNAYSDQNQEFQQNVPQEVDPIEELERKEKIYRQAADQAGSAGEGTKAREYLSQADAFQRKALAEKKLIENRRQFQQTKDTERENRVLPIQESAMQTVEKTGTQLNALNSQMQAVREGSVSPFSKGNLANLLRSTGHDILAAAAESQGSAIFKTAGKEVIAGGLKDAFGGRPAIVEFEAYNAMLPEVGRNKKANELAIFSLQVPLIIKNETAKYKLDLIKNNPNISPIQLNNEAYQYSEQVKDQVYDEWKNILNGALEISQKEGSQNWWQRNFGQKSDSKEKSIPSNRSQEKQSLEDIWK